MSSVVIEVRVQSSIVEVSSTWDMLVRSPTALGPLDLGGKSHVRYRHEFDRLI